jgi:hypothetical protein
MRPRRFIKVGRDTYEQLAPTEGWGQPWLNGGWRLTIIYLNPTTPGDKILCRIWTRSLRGALTQWYYVNRYKVWMNPNRELCRAITCTFDWWRR